ncbi:MAG: GGDEF domain-containing protein [Lachnotalea sp.]
MDIIVFIDASNIVACTLISAFTSYTVSCARLKEIRANMRLERACNTDELTGLPNRRNFNKYITNIFDNSAYKTLTLMMIDIDNFKDYNDSYGQVYGDNCLTTIGNIFLEFEETYNCYIARYGGDEFVLVDDVHTLIDIEIIAKNLIQTISNMNIENINSKYNKITLSIGIASKPTSEVKNYIDLINLADEALYQAKQNGKNTFMIARHCLNDISK